MGFKLQRFGTQQSNCWLPAGLLRMRQRWEAEAILCLIFGGRMVTVAESGSRWQAGLCVEIYNLDSGIAFFDFKIVCKMTCRSIAVHQMVEHVYNIRNQHHDHSIFPLILNVCHCAMFINFPKLDTTVERELQGAEATKTTTYELSGPFSLLKW